MAAIEYYATGRRKTSTARLFLRPGTGAITVNHRDFDKHFPTDLLRTVVLQPVARPIEVLDATVRHERRFRLRERTLQVRVARTPKH